MIAGDTSALMAILLDEPEADDCMVAIQEVDPLLISAGTMAEALIVAGRRNLGDNMAELIDGLDFEIVTLTAASARRIAAIYGCWARVSIPRRSTLATASPTKSPPTVMFGSSMSEATSQTDVRPVL